jgi:hypothetical protein
MKNNDENQIGFFYEDVNVKSMTRLKSFILEIFLCVFDFVYILIIEEMNWGFLIFNALIVIAIYYPQYLKQLIEAGANWKGITIGGNSKEDKNNSEKEILK